MPQRPVALFSTPVWLVLAVLSFATTISPAFAAITRVVVDDSGVMGAFGGRTYTWVTARMEGVVERDDGSVGFYRVPITLNYPDRGSNGFGFVDVVNDASYSWYTNETAGLGRPFVGYTGDLIFSDFLRREGFTYVSVQWDYAVAQIFGPDYAVIQRPTDGNEIIKDAARLLRALDTFVSSLAPVPPALNWVIGHGQSGPAWILRGLVWAGENREEDGGPSFDGLILTGTNGQTCRLLVNEQTTRARPFEWVGPEFAQTVECLELPDAGKLITLRSQTEVELSGTRAGRAPNERLYDVAGVSHIPGPLYPLMQVGAHQQNPVSWSPAAKVLLFHLSAWIEFGTEPPESVFIRGEYDEQGRFQMATDDDGNALGGIRLPHMRSQLPNGDLVGAPLGLYTGMDWDIWGVRDAGFAGLGGTFVPFGPDEISRRYPTQGEYVELVERAAAMLVTQGFMLHEDYDAYVRAARREHLHDLSP